MARQSSHLNFDLELHSVRAGPVWLMFSVKRFLIDKKYILRGGGMIPIIRSALVNIRRKALGHLMKFTQGRLKYT